MIFDLFVELKANDEQLDFPIVYASAKNGFAMRELHENSEDMTPLFQAIIDHVPPPEESRLHHISRCSFRTSITAITSDGSRSVEL